MQDTWYFPVAGNTRIASLTDDFDPPKESMTMLRATYGSEEVVIELPGCTGTVRLDSLEEAVAMARRVVNGEWPPRQPPKSRRVL